MIKDSINSLNPVSIIALFAALSEASAATALPFLNEENQEIYVWFLIAFPSSLTLMFFLTLNFNYKALYAPSDFSNEKNFLKFFKRSGSKLKATTPAIESDSAPGPTAPPTRMVILLKARNTQLDSDEVTLINQCLERIQSPDTVALLALDSNEVLFV